MSLPSAPETAPPIDWAVVVAYALTAFATLNIFYHVRNWTLPANDSIMRIDSRAWDPNWSEGPVWNFLSDLYTERYGRIRGMNLLTDRSYNWR